MNTLETQKQLLLAESELNRVHLFADLERLTTAVGTLATEVGSIGSITSSAAALVAGLAAFERHSSHAAAAKPPWWQTLLSNAGIITGVLRLFSGSSREDKRR